MRYAKEHEQFTELRQRLATNQAYARDMTRLNRGLPTPCEKVQWYEAGYTDALYEAITVIDMILGGTYD